MARSHLRHIVSRSGLGAIQNAKVFLYLAGTTTPVSDAWNAATGGSAVTTLTTNSQGEVECWLDTPKSVDLSVTDNNDGAYPSGNAASLQSWNPITETVETVPAPAEILHASTDRLAGQVGVVPSTGTGLRWSFGIEWLDPRDGDGLGGNRGVFEVGSDVTAAVNACIARVPLGSGGHILWPGPGVLSSRILIDQRRGLTIQGMGWGKSTVTPTNALSNDSVFRFQNYEKSGVKDLHILGNTGAAPLYAIEFRENHGVDPTATVSTAGIVENVRFGSSSSNSLVNCIGFTTAGLDENNDLAHIVNPQCYNFSGAGIKVTHRNSLLHHIIGGTIHGAKGIELAGGSVVLLGTQFSTTSWLLDFGAGVYDHHSVLTGLTSEGAGPWVRSNSGAVSLGLKAVGCEFRQGIPSQTVVDWQAPSSWLSFVNCVLDNGQAGCIADFGQGTTTPDHRDNDLRVVASTVGVAEMRWSGKLALLGNSDQTGSLTLTPGSTGKLSRIAENNGGGQFQTIEWREGAAVGKLFFDVATGQVKVTDATSTRQV